MHGTPVVPEVDARDRGWIAEQAAQEVQLVDGAVEQQILIRAPEVVRRPERERLVDQRGALFPRALQRFRGDIRDAHERVLRNVRRDRRLERRHADVAELRHVTQPFRGKPVCGIVALVVPDRKRNVRVAAGRDHLIGLSTKTWSPRRAAAIAGGACDALVRTMTASRSLATSSRQSVRWRSTPYARATARAVPGERSQTAAISNRSLSSRR